MVLNRISKPPPTPKSWTILGRCILWGFSMWYNTFRIGLFTDYSRIQQSIKHAWFDIEIVNLLKVTVCKENLPIQTLWIRIFIGNFTHEIIILFSTTCTVASQSSQSPSCNGPQRQNEGLLGQPDFLPVSGVSMYQDSTGEMRHLGSHQRNTAHHSQSNGTPIGSNEQGSSLPPINTVFNIDG